MTYVMPHQWCHEYNEHYFFTPLFAGAAAAAFGPGAFAGAGAAFAGVAFGSGAFAGAGAAFPGVALPAGAAFASALPVAFASALGTPALDVLGAFASAAGVGDA